MQHPLWLKGAPSNQTIMFSVNRCFLKFNTIMDMLNVPIIAENTQSARFATSCKKEKTH